MEGNQIKLNKSQYEAVFSTTSRLAIIAGPGTGKTRTLVTRIKRLLGEGLPASSVMALTFTNKAAREIKERLDSPDIFSGTFHSLFYLLIIQYLDLFPEFPFPPSIYDRADSQDIIKEVIERLISPLKMGQVEKILIRKYQDLEESFTQHEAAAIREYERLVIYEGKALSFDMILFFFLKGLRENKTFRNDLRNRFQYIFVDEYQDTNRIQSEILRLIDPENICIVGDLDQSIYAWRGAKLEELIRFTKQEGTQTVFLNTSYRCTPEILKAAHNLITNNEVGFKQEIFSIHPPNEHSFSIRQFGDSTTQNSAIASQAKGQTDLAILTRTNREAADLHDILKKHGVENLLLTSEQELWADDLIKNILSYLKLIINPLSVYHLQRTFRLPRREWWNPRLKSEIRLQSLQNTSPPINTYKERYPKDLLWDILQKFTPDHQALEVISHLVSIIREQSELLPNKDLLVNKMISRVSAWANKTDDSRLSAFVRFVTFLESQDQVLFQDCPVKVMTIHGAKGLEFQKVIIPNVIQGNIPSGKGDLEEERRLLYVAITRAKKSCNVLYSLSRALPSFKNNGFLKTISSIPSQFINEIATTKEIFQS